jgi:hypothetical protein
MAFAVDTVSATAADAKAGSLEKIREGRSWSSYSAVAIGLVFGDALHGVFRFTLSQPPAI